MNTASNNFQNIWDVLSNKGAGEDSPSTNVDEKAPCAHKDDPDETVTKRTVSKRRPVETVIGKIEAEELTKIKSVDIKLSDYGAAMDRFLSSCIKL